MPDKAEWKLGGQVLDITLPLEDPVSVVKAKIHEITNMPPGKQKLNWEVRSCSLFKKLIIVIRITPVLNLSFSFVISGIILERFKFIGVL